VFAFEIVDTRTVFGPAPMRIARPEGAIGAESGEGRLREQVFAAVLGFKEPRAHHMSPGTIASSMRDVAGAASAAPIPVVMQA